MALVHRVAASPDLRRAARLREFLLYVCTETLERGASSIREQEIGENVFGRPSGYDTNIDNIVRVNASSLRKRLEQYFAEDGAQEEILVEVPRGSYTPLFRRRSLPQTPVTVSAASSLASQPLDGSESTRPSWSSRIPATFRDFWFVAAVLLLAGCAALLWQNRSLEKQLRRWRSEPAMRALWANFFAEGAQTDVVIADTSFSLAQDLLQQPVPLSDYINYSYKRLAEAPNLSNEQRYDLNMVLSRNYGSIGDFRAAQQILSLNSDPKLAVLKFAHEFTTADAKRDSLVLIGSQASNPWVSLFADKLNFAMQYDPVKRQASIMNRSVQRGEQAIYSAPDAPVFGTPQPRSTGYGVIAYLPNLSGKGKTLILEGTDSQATAATGEFVMSEDALSAFETKFPKGPIPSFEILLRTSQLSGTPLHAEIIAFRVYPASRVR